ncbi:hypothetical protein E1B28_007763 [Marasmius oreades]|uniref:Fungal-type protein kinase domain-containing protein n=1 Tax=Marasmius oreades TaxID=181124 RepID=A0A9P7S2A3_9AGAR|nr:uncharacterized protein E1B28_007763 [Marasmius oreades]KAG7094151.1 hypothetical protein E1B28_007763 [Marasmius oreades]
MGCRDRQMEIPVEVGPSWHKILPQAALYCLFKASPSRSWSLVFGFNTVDKTLPSLIFHRGGCIPSTDLILATDPGRKEAYRLILTMTEDYHAGFCCFSTDEEYAISGRQGGPTLTVQVQKKLHHSLGVCTRGTLVIVSKVRQRHWIHTSSCSCHSDVVSQASEYTIVKRLPSNGSAKDWEQAQIGRGSWDDLTENPRTVLCTPQCFRTCRDCTNLYIELLKVRQRRLLTATSGLLVSNRIFLPGEEESQYKDVWVGSVVENKVVVRCSPLLESVSHALLGWLVYYQNSFMHPDVSIGNVLRLEPGPAMKTIDIIDPFSVTDASLKEHEQLGISSECKGILIDGDMATNWKIYLDKDHDSHSPSGTDGFMSMDLLWAFEDGLEYLQSPVDDIHSFFWISGRKRWAERAAVKEDIARLFFSFTHPRSPIAEQPNSFLSQWLSQNEALQDDWYLARNSADLHDKKEWYITHFDLFAYRGVCETWRLILQHREESDHSKPPT